jgi:hypothetical protein
MCMCLRFHYQADAASSAPKTPIVERAMSGTTTPLAKVPTQVVPKPAESAVPAPVVPEKVHNATQTDLDPEPEFGVREKLMETILKELESAEVTFEKKSGSPRKKQTRSKHNIAPNSKIPHAGHMYQFGSV